MDAKPQRPFRAQPFAGNENMPPPGHFNPQQVKAPANVVPSYPANGAMNVAPRRTVFNDMSNVGKNTTGGGAKNYAKHEAILPVPVDQENTDLTAWAGKYEKPKSAAYGVNQKLTAQAVERVFAASQTTAKPIATKAIANSLGPVVKTGNSKKATLVYHDNQEQDSGVYPQISHSKDDLLSATDKPAKHPRQYKSQPQLKFGQQQLRRTQSRALPQNNHGEVAALLARNHGGATDDVTGAFYVDAVEHQLPEELASTAFSTNNLNHFKPENAERRSALTHDYDLQRLAEYDILCSDLSRELPEHIEQAHPLPSVPGQVPREQSIGHGVAFKEEPEELWEEEEDQVAYEDQAYITAHSYRSLVDNTTDAVTTVMAPETDERTRMELSEAKKVVEANLDPDEVEDEEWDVSMVAEYSDEIFDYMKTLEKHLLPNPHYMDIQTEIQWSMRGILMEWIVQIHGRFQLLPETLFLTVNYIDRFLSVKVVSIGKLQLVGITALFLAAKYEEINCPSIAEVVYMVDSGYSAEEILKAERYMLTMLQFELGWPGPMSFLRRISKADECDLDTRTLAKYFLEVTVMDERFVGTRPSYIAAGAHCLARLILGKGDNGEAEWTHAHTFYSGYTLDQLKPLVLEILECCKEPKIHHDAVFQKYSNKKYKQVSTLVMETIMEGFSLEFPASVTTSWPHPSSQQSDSRRPDIDYLVSLA